MLNPDETEVPVVPPSVKKLPKLVGKATGSAKSKSNKAVKKPAKKATKKVAAKTTKKKAARNDEGKVLVEPDLSRYKVSTDVKTAGGKPSIDVNDDLAKELRGMPLEDLYPLAAKELKQTENDLVQLYSHLNPGMQRMNLGNRIRRARRLKEQEAHADKKAKKKPAKKK